MDYPKRNQLRGEIDILIERVSILQDQEKSYDDLSDKIKAKKLIIESLDKEQKWLDNTIKEQKEKLSKMWEEMQCSISDMKKIESQKRKEQDRVNNEKRSYTKQMEINDVHLKRIQKSIQKHSLRDEEIKIKTINAEKDYENFITKIKNDKWDLFDKITNWEKELALQEWDKQKLKEDILSLTNDYRELDEQYQKLLENYIITQ